MFYCMILQLRDKLGEVALDDRYIGNGNFIVSVNVCVERVVNVFVFGELTLDGGNVADVDRSVKIRVSELDFNKREAVCGGVCVTLRVAAADSANGKVGDLNVIIDTEVITERISSDTCNAFGNGDACQRRTAVKREGVDDPDAAGYPDIGQAGTAVKRVIGYFDNGIRNNCVFAAHYQNGGRCFNNGVAAAAAVINGIVLVHRDALDSAAVVKRGVKEGRHACGYDDVLKSRTAGELVVVKPRNA